MNQEEINYTVGIITSRLYQIEKIQDMMQHKLRNLEAEFAKAKNTNNANKLVELSLMIDELTSTLSTLAEEYYALEEELDTIIIAKLQTIAQTTYTSQKEIKERQKQNEGERSALVNLKKSTLLKLDNLSPENYEYNHLVRKLERIDAKIEILNAENQELGNALNHLLSPKFGE